VILFIYFFELKKSSGEEISCSGFSTLVFGYNSLSRESTSEIANFDSLIDFHDNLIYSAEILNSINEALTVFTNMNITIKNSKNLIIRYFSVPELLSYCGFGDISHNLPSSISSSGPFLSLLKYCLAYRYGHINLDLGVHLLKLSMEKYRNNFVSAITWHDEGASIEFTDKFFCLPNRILAKLLNRMHQRLEISSLRQIPKIEFSSKLLIKTVLGSLDEIFLLSTNKPNTATLDALITSCQVHNHHFIIESEFMREKRLNASLNYIDFNNQVRTQLGLHIIETVSSQ